MDGKNEILETNQSLDMLIAASIELIQYARQITAKQVNLVQLMTYYSLGKWIERGTTRRERTSKIWKAGFEKIIRKPYKRIWKRVFGNKLGVCQKILFHICRLNFPDAV